jgi:hypothetical protein
MCPTWEAGISRDQLFVGFSITGNSMRRIFAFIAWCRNRCEASIADAVGDV